MSPGRLCPPRHEAPPPSWSQTWTGLETRNKNQNCLAEKGIFSSKITVYCAKNQHSETIDYTIIVHVHISSKQRNDSFVRRMNPCYHCPPLHSLPLQTSTNTLLTCTHQPPPHPLPTYTDQHTFFVDVPCCQRSSPQLGVVLTTLAKKVDGLSNYQDL